MPSHEGQRVLIVGAGSWGCAIARIVGRNVAANPRMYIGAVQLWIADERVASGELLSEAINRTHENPKYLPGAALPDNVIAEPDLARAAHQATLVLFAVPQQHINRGMFAKILAGCAPNCRVLSLVKGLSFSEHLTRDEHGGTTVALVPTLVSRQIANELAGLDVSVLMGANVAAEVAADEFCEATLGVRTAEAGEVWYRLLNLPTFRLNVVLDVEGVEVCGGLKNLVALGAGFCDGLRLGSNTKAAIVRIGLEEMRRFGQKVFGARTETFFESCGVGDVLTSCYSATGRHRLCAEAFASTHAGKSWATIEAELLRGQALADLKQARDVISFLRAKGVHGKYPLFSHVHAIAFEGARASEIVSIGQRRAWRKRTGHGQFGPIWVPAAVVAAALALLLGGLQLGWAPPQWAGFT